MSSYGIIEPATSEGSLHTVAKFLEKPKPEETTSRLGVIGKYIITPEIFEYLERANQASNSKTSASKDGEIRLADAFECMVQDGGQIYGLEME